MFGIGGFELLVIVAVALIALGPRRLPDAARALGKAASQLRRATRELRHSIELDPQMGDLPKSLHELGRPIIDPFDRPVPPPARPPYGANDKPSAELPAEPADEAGPKDGTGPSSAPVETQSTNTRAGARMDDGAKDAAAAPREVAIDLSPPAPVAPSTDTSSHQSKPREHD